MPISVACECGKSFRVKDELAGRRIRCPYCETSISVPDPAAPEKSVARSSQAVVAGDRARPPRMPRPRDDDDDRRPSARRRPSRDEDDDDDDLPPRSRRSRDDDDEPAPKRKKRKKRARRRSSGGGGFNIAVHPQIITGLLMMIGAAAWFIVGIANGYIFFYPPVLFVLGIAAVFRGLMGGD